MTPTDVAGWVAIAPALFALFVLICLVTAALERTEMWDRIVHRVTERIVR